MFGEKARKIREQQEEIETLRSQLEAAQSHPQLPLAIQIDAQIRQMVDERIANGQTVDMDALVNMVIKDANDAALEDVLYTQLANVPVPELLEIFDRRVGHVEVNKYLAKRAIAEFESLKRTMTLDQMREEAMRTRRIDLSKTPLHSIVTIGLFPSDWNRGIVGYNHRHWAARTIVGRTDNPDAPHELTILEDVIDREIYESEDFAGNSAYSGNATVQIGEEEFIPSGKRYVNRIKDYVIKPYLTYGTHPATSKGSQGHTGKFYRHDVGYVMIDDVVVLDNPEDMKSKA